MGAWEEEFRGHLVAAMEVAQRELAAAELCAVLTSTAVAIRDLARRQGLWDQAHYELCLQVGARHFDAAELAAELAAES